MHKALGSIPVPQQTIQLKQPGDEPGEMIHAYNPSYVGGGNWEHLGSRPVQGKGPQDPILTDKLGVVVHACHPSYAAMLAQLSRSRP
jgi:hypothetical protein